MTWNEDCDFGPCIAVVNDYRFPYEFDENDVRFRESCAADDAHFITEAREGWPAAIRRAVAAEAEVKRLKAAAKPGGPAKPKPAAKTKTASRGAKANKPVR